MVLKFLPASVLDDRDALEEVRGELLKIQKLTHPNIVQVTAFFQVPGEPPFLVMECADGPSLDTYRQEQEGGVMAWKFLAPLAVELAEALVCAHGEKVLHRDLKPANLILDKSGNLKVTDFGLAWILNEAARRNGDPRHQTKTAFLSPQVQQGDLPTVSDDVYAFGATLFVLLTAQSPEAAEGAATNSTPDGLETVLINRKVPEKIRELILECLNTNPDARPENVEEILELLAKAGLKTSTEKSPLPGLIIRPESFREKSLAFMTATKLRRVLTAILMVALAWVIYEYIL